MSELLKIFEFTADQAKALSKEQSVTGEPIVIGEVTVVPVSKLSCGFTGGGSDLAQKKKADGIMAGAGVKITKTPLSFLAVCGKEVQILHVAEEEAKTKGLINALLPLVAQLKDKAKKAAPEESDAAE